AGDGGGTGLSAGLTGPAGDGGGTGLSAGLTGPAGDGGGTGLSAGLTGPAGDGGGTLFVALARLTRDPDPSPLPELVSVAVRTDDGRHGEHGGHGGRRGDRGHRGYEMRVTWSDGPAAAFRFTAADGPSAVPVWSVAPL
ncbi:hypothetical protein ABZ576_20805, partial [Streptomyces sp. NPDC013455]